MDLGARYPLYEYVSRDGLINTTFGAAIEVGYVDGHVRSVGPLDFDLVVFQRPVDQHIAETITLIRRQGVAVCIELDDDFWHIDRQNIAYESFHEPRRNVKYLERACREADLVTVSTPALLSVVPTSTIRVLPNFVPQEYLTLEVNPEAPWAMFEDRVIVGWTGNPATHPGDLETTQRAVVHAVRQTDSVFFAVGSVETGRILGFDPEESAYCPPVVLEKYPCTVKGLDVGIVPLRLTQFNEAKSWLKGLEYAALGVPFIASPTGEYLRLFKKGAGLIAKNPAEWQRRLASLLANEPYREEVARRGFEAVSEMTYEKNAHRWADAWTKAVDNYKKGH